ncbi:PspA/IM30 family protein [Methylocystis parvus]|uniref:PspA/IM30 family protein n=1 Tax=Methylocystis parvus TaxID=134 RepID=A0A6B8LXQ8_9HYPH|nr:PspA/IM30 family protein [Methylocystis parvus]QGM97187.1 PspA/IM30 family protein [Methylocystis parvus]WBJ98909.1 PspA/IM30 family protein [Methylocystis parvus OBBP]
MFKTVVTLLRGRAFEAEERLADRHALSLLDQQMRDAALSVDRAKKALAVAIAQDKAEARKLEAARAQIAELEPRAVAALQAGREDMAQKAAENIAALEGDAQAAEKARALFAAEIAKLERHVRNQSARLAELERGRRIARASEAVRIARRGRLEEAPCYQSTLSEAEATLARLRERQLEVCAAETALDALDAEPRAESLNETLAEAGFGPPVKPRAADVLARLKEKAGAPR